LRLIDLRLSREDLRSELWQRLGEISGEKIVKCYQCGKCSAGCPLDADADPPAHQVCRLVQLGMVHEAMQTKTIWLCAACGACSARCPRGIDLPRLMEALRAMVLRGAPPVLHASELPKEVLERAPQQGLVGGLRKLSG